MKKIMMYVKAFLEGLFQRARVQQISMFKESNDYTF
jgi:hypothetical protein